MNWWFWLFGDGDLSILLGGVFIIVGIFGTALGIGYILSH